MTEHTKIPRKYQPKGFEIFYEDAHIIVGNKEAGLLTVAAKWEREQTVHHLLNLYVRKGNSKSKRCVYVVHRLDQATSGLLIFAKTEEALAVLKNNWPMVKKTYYTVVCGKMPQQEGVISSYLAEDEDYVVHSSQGAEGKLAKTEYSVVKEGVRYSLVKINLLTGRKNQIRVHMADCGHPVLGDSKYGAGRDRFPRLALHALALEFPHPITGELMQFETELPKMLASLFM